MFVYFTSLNLCRAACIAGVAGLMAAPRIFELAGDSLGVLLAVSAFPLLTIVAGCATAWGGAGGMAGPFPEWRRALPWTAGAVLAGGLALPAMLWYDSFLQLALAEGDPLRLIFAVPQTPQSAVALMLWSAGFETVLFQAGAMSFVARLTGRGDAAIAAGTAFKLFVFLLKCGESGFGPVTVLSAVGVTAVTGFTCVLYARAGFPAAMAFNAITDARHLLHMATAG